MGRHPLYDAKRRYAHHKNKARSRNIEFNFTFEDWYQWWLDQGVDKNSPEITGNSSKGTDLCMARKNDQGPYEYSNVYCCTKSQNSKDAAKNGRGVYPGAPGKEVIIDNITYSSMTEASKQLNIPYGKLWHQYHNGKQGVKIK